MGQGSYGGKKGKSFISYLLAKIFKFVKFLLPVFARRMY